MDKSRREFVRDALGTGIALYIAPVAGHNQTSLQTPPSKAATKDPYELVDPELVPFLKTLPKATLNNDNLAALRGIPAPTPIAPPAPQPTQRRIHGPKGAPDILLTVLDPAPGRKGQPGFLYIHGGGYTTGSSAMEIRFLQKIAQSCKCVVVSVDYRLAPEAHFPAALEDNYAALQWLYTNASIIGVDSKRIAVGGACSGGGHAAALVIAARDRKEIPIIFQLLLQPMLDDRTGSTRPVPRHIGEFVWTPESNSFGWTALLGVPAGSPNVPIGSVPARVHSLVGLPPTFIGVGSIDLFVSEDIEYARRLINVGVPTELHVLPGAYHGFFTLVPEAAISIRFNEYWTNALQRAFARQ